MLIIFFHLFKGYECSIMLIYFPPTVQHVVLSQVVHIVVQRIVLEQIHQLSLARFAEMLLHIKTVLILPVSKALWLDLKIQTRRSDM